MGNGSAHRNILLVHGAWHGAWCWDRLVPELQAGGWTPWTVDLPSSGGDPDAGMLADAQAIRRRLEDIGGPATVVAHSYGGVPAAEAAGSVEGVERLIYLAAHVLEPGESMAAAERLPVRPGPPVLVPPPANARDLLYHDVAPDLATEAVEKLRPLSSRAATDVLSRASWQTIPTTSIICRDDRIQPAVHAERQRTWIADVRYLPGSHSPFLSRPGELARLIGQIAD